MMPAVCYGVMTAGPASTGIQRRADEALADGVVTGLSLGMLMLRCANSSVGDYSAGR
jgi:hypothetical protein